MKGLLLKDLYNIRHNAKQMIFLMFFLSVCLISSTGADGIIIFSCIMCSMMTITTISMDERCGFMKYAFVMPVTVPMYVLEKYLVNLIFSLTGAAFGMTVSLAYRLYTNNFVLKDYLIVSLSGLLVVIFFGSLYIPILFRFGSEHARFVMLGVAAVPSALLFGGYKLLSYLGVSFTRRFCTILGITGLILLAVILLCSYFYSVNTVKKKEF